MFGSFQLLLLSYRHYVNFLLELRHVLLSPLSLTLPPPPSSLLHFSTPSVFLPSLSLPLLPPSHFSSPSRPLPLPSSSHLPLPRFTHQVLQSVGNLQLEMDAKEACMKPMSEILPRSVERLKTFVQEILQIDQKTGEL